MVGQVGGMVLNDYTLADFYQAAGIECPTPLADIVMGLKPWDHQVGDLRYLVAKERFGIWNDAGTGKTIPMQASIAMWAALGNQVVMVMPPKLIGQWIGNFKSDFIGIEKVLDICPFSTYNARKKRQLLTSWQSGEKIPDVLVMSYNTFRDLHPIKRKPAKRVKQPDGTFISERPKPPPRHHPLKQLGYAVLYFDEAHALKNNASTVHKVLWKWVGDSEGEFVVHLFTGSPIPNTLMDAFGMIRLVYPECYPTKRSFERAHVVYDPYSDFREIQEFKDPERLYANLYTNGRRVTKQDVLKDLPPMIPIQQTIELSKEHRKLYRKLMTQRILELPDGDIIDATHVSKLRQTAMQLLTSPELYTDEKINNEIENWLMETINSINANDHKIIIFCYYKRTVEKLTKLLQHLNPSVIYGSTKDPEHERKKFISDPSSRAIIMNIDSGGTGLNLQVSHYVIFYEPPITPMQANQGISRSHRGGQDKAVTVFLNRVKATIAAKRLDDLLDKEANNNLVVKDRHQLLNELLGQE